MYIEPQQGVARMENMALGRDRHGEGMGSVPAPTISTISIISIIPISTA